MKPTTDSKENIIGSSGPVSNAIQNQAEASEEELSQIDEDSQSNYSELKTPT